MRETGSFIGGEIVGQHAVDTVSVRVPCGEGHLIGDILRKYATRSVGTWQIAGYKVDSQSENFGFSNGVMVSYLELLKGALLCTSVQSPGDPVLCRFVWNGECFAYKDFELHNLPKNVGDSLTVCLVYARGYRSAEQNYETIKSVAGDTAEGFFAVPSAHSVVNTFRYSVKPQDDSYEWLQIEADQGVASNALQSAVKSLQGLDI